jgi:hypothetical protein
MAWRSTGDTEASLRKIREQELKGTLALTNSNIAYKQRDVDKSRQQIKERPSETEEKFLRVLERQLADLLATRDQLGAKLKALRDEKEDD